ncbi:MAG: hypothetical protein WC642_14375, partial [Nocardioides sp.]
SADWAEAFEAPAPGTPHNEARDQVWDELLTILTDKLDSDDGDVPPELLRRGLARNDELVDAFNRAWPILEADDLVGDLWEVPAYLRRCAPWLTPDEVRALQRAHPQAWTLSDLPLLDAARQRLGDPQASVRRRRHAAAIAAEREEMERVVDHLVATDDSEMQVMSMLRVSDAQSVIIDEAALATADPDQLAGPFAHIVVDEAQELTDAEWQMLLLRCPSRSFTIVGDRAQARHGFTETWQERLERIGLDRVDLASLSINYRTPTEVMTEAEPVIRSVLPDANVPTSVRSTGVPVLHGSRSDLRSILDAWLDEHAEGTACVIAVDGVEEGGVPATPRVRSLTPELSKGLEFDLVVLLDPETFGDGIEGTVDRYVAMTRATQRLVVLSGWPLARTWQGGVRGHIPSTPGSTAPGRDQTRRAHTFRGSGTAARTDRARRPRPDALACLHPCGDRRGPVHAGDVAGRHRHVRPWPGGPTHRRRAPRGVAEHRPVLGLRPGLVPASRALVRPRSHLHTLQGLDRHGLPCCGLWHVADRVPAVASGERTCTPYGARRRRNASASTSPARAWTPARGWPASSSTACPTMGAVIA